MLRWSLASLCVLVLACVWTIPALGALVTIPVTNWVNVAGSRFATLDNVVPTSTTSGCQNGALGLPSGWTLAKSNTASHVAIMSFQWGAQCLVLSGGASLNVRTGTSCGSSALVGSATKGYSVASCNKRILITQSGISSDVDVTLVGTLSNFLIFNRRVFATMDNTLPSDKSVGCQTVLKALPTGWTIAADDATTHAIMLGTRYTFGTNCGVLANSKSYSMSSGAACGTTDLLRYSTTKYYGAASCDKRVLITRAATKNEPDTWNANVTVSNFVVSNGAMYATMDDTPAAATDMDCQDVAYLLQPGWTIDKSDATTAFVIGTNNFGTNCLVLADGTSIAHDGTLCSGGVNQLVSYQNYYAVNWCFQRVMITKAVPATPPPPPPTSNRTLGWKILLISSSGDPDSEPALGVMRTAMLSMGVSYDEYAVQPSANAPAGVATGTLSLVSGTDSNAGKYFAFVATSDYALRGLQPDSLTSANLATLEAYLKKFGTRMVVMYSYPSGRGVAAASGSGGANRNIRLTAAYASQVTSMPATMSVAITGIWAYPASITDKTIATSVLEFTSTTNVLQGTAGVILNALDGRVEMHFYFDQAFWSLHSSVLVSLWMPWVTRNMYIGSRRLVLAPQIDDLFLSTEAWLPSKSCSCGAAVRVSASSLRFLADYSEQVNQANPGTSLKYTLAFNGQGVIDAGGIAADSLYNEVKVNKTRYYFESHTYTHLDLTENDGTDGNLPLHATTYAEAYSEVLNNQNFAAVLFGSSASFDAHSIVTPGISGLFNGNALRALYDLGIRYTVGDNSHPELLPTTSPYHGITTTVAIHGFAGMFIVPRYPTDVFYDTSNTNQETAEYNTYYQSYWGRALTLAEIMQNDASRTVSNLLAFRHDPYMFHQANLVVGTYTDPVTGTSKPHSLLTLWTSYVFKTLRQYSTLPVVSKMHKELAADLLARQARDNCGASGSLSMDATGRIVSVSVSSTGSCTLGITGVTVAGMSETYGPDVTSWVPMTAGAPVTITLSSPVQFQ